MPPNSDHANKEIALRRIKRICSSGLPLYPLARALFELLGDAIPHGANRVLLADDGHHPDHYITSSSELAKWNPVYKHFYLDSPPAGFRCLPVPSILQGKVVRTHEEVASPISTGPRVTTSVCGISASITRCSSICAIIWD